MNVHPLLPEFLQIAYGCMACDGEIAAAEVSCLRSIAIQMGQPVKQVDAGLQAVHERFVADAHGMVDRARNKLLSQGMSAQDSVLLLDLLIQLVEADGVIQPNEVRYIRDIVNGLDLDREALSAMHPEWQSYLAQGFHIQRRREWPFEDAFATLQDITLNPRPE